MNLQEPGRIFTFYSYKGGVGRSMALANIAALISKRNLRTLVIDWDLEAPGIEKYFENPLVRLEGNRKDVPGIVDLIEAHTQGTHIDWKSCLLSAYPFLPDMPVHIISAGKDDGQYVDRVQRLDWGKLFSEHNLAGYFEELREQWKRSYDVILIDSRTGITDIGGVCTIHLPDVLVLLFTTNQQSLAGISDVMHRARESHASLPYDRERLIAVPVPTRFENVTEYKLAGEWLNRIADELQIYYKDWLPRGVTGRDALEQVRIPYIAYWSFGEPLSVIKESASDPKNISFAYDRLARLIASGLDWDSLTASDDARTRDEPIGVMVEQAEAVFAALSPAEQVEARRLFQRLVRLPLAHENVELAPVRIPRKSLKPEMAELAGRFLKAGTLKEIKQEPSGEMFLEISHGGMLKGWERLGSWLGWERLGTWLKEDREFLEWRQKLDVAVAEWESADRSPSKLLIGERAALATEWRSKKSDDLSDVEIAFIDSSRRRQKRRVAMKRSVQIAVVLLVLWAASWYVFMLIPEGKAKTYFMMGEDQFEQEKYDSAIISYTLALEQRSAFPEAYCKRGWARWKTQQLPGAKNDVDSAIILNPAYPDALVLRARMELTANDSSAARRDLDAALATEPRHVDGLFFRAAMYSHDGMDEQAVQYYSRAIAVNGSRADLLSGRASSNLALGDSAAGLGDLNQALIIDPNDQHALRLRGRYFFQVKSYLASIADFSQLLSLQPNDAAATYGRGMCYYFLERKEKAIVDLNTAFVIESDSSIRHEISGVLKRLGTEPGKKAVQGTVLFYYTDAHDSSLVVKVAKWVGANGFKARTTTKAAEPTLGEIRYYYSRDAETALEVSQIVLDYFKKNTKYNPNLTFVNASKSRLDERPGWIEVKVPALKDGFREMSIQKSQY